MGPDDTSTTEPEPGTETPETPETTEPEPAPEPALRVSDARANECHPYSSGTMHFTVTLAPAAGHDVTVRYQTRDGTARGDLYGISGDYREEYGQLYFAPGETSKTVSVDLIGDWHDEGDETFSLVLSDASGARIADGVGVGTIVNDGPLQREWLSRFGRTVAGQMVEALEGRLAMGADAPSHLTVAGQHLDLSGASPLPSHDRWRYEDTLGREMETRDMDLRELLLGSSFHFTSGEVSGLGAVGDASRVRAVLEGSRAFSLSGGGSVEPSLILGLRHDGGDAETGTEVEMGAGLA